MIFIVQKFCDGKLGITDSVTYFLPVNFINVVSAILALKVASRYFC